MTTKAPYKIIWQPDTYRGAKDRDYLRALTDFVSTQLGPNVSLSDVHVFEDQDGRWIGSTRWNFETRSYKPVRKLINPDVRLP